MPDDLPSMETTTESFVSVERDAVLSWRFDQLDEAGYPEAAMLLLGQRTDVDLHLATSLLRNGCPIETALRILL